MQFAVHCNSECMLLAFFAELEDLTFPDRPNGPALEAGTDGRSLNRTVQQTRNICTNRFRGVCENSKMVAVDRPALNDAGEKSRMDKSCDCI